MGTFADGQLIDPYTTRPVVNAIVRVLEFETDTPVEVEGALATGPHGTYPQFTVPGHDIVTLEAGGARRTQVSFELLTNPSGSITGTVETFADLPESPSAIPAAYVTRDDQTLYVWEDGGWTSVGSIKGPPGDGAVDDPSVSALVSAPSDTRDAVIAAVADSPLMPEGGARSVGKGELARNVLDYIDLGGNIAAQINTLLDQGGEWLAPGNRNYPITEPLRFTKSNTVLHTQSGTVFQVPVGYAGDAVLIGDTVTQIINVKLLGPAEIKEPGKSGGASTVPGSWTAFHFYGNTTGVTDVTVEWVSWWPNRRAYYEISGAGWVNGSRVTGNSWYPRVMLECNKNGSGAVGFAGNTWTDVVSQCGQHTTHVTKGLTGRGWTFKDVSPWDIGHNPAAVSLDVDADALSVVIVGGLMTTQNVQNRAAAGQVTVIDQATLPPWSTRAVIGAAGMAVDTTQPASATLVRRTQTLAWQFADAVISGTGFTLQVPPRATKAVVTLHMAGTGSTTGNARMAVTLSSSANAGTNLSAAFTSRQATVPMGANDVVVEAVLDELVTVPGQVLCMRPYRVGADALDTYAGNVVLTAVTVTYRT